MQKARQGRPDKGQSPPGCKRRDRGLDLLKKLDIPKKDSKTYSKTGSKTELLFFIFLLSFCSFSLFCCFSLLPTPAAGSEINGGEEGISETETAVITDFYSDHDLCEAAVRFDRPLENVSLNLSLSSGKNLLKSETLPLGSAKAGEEITKIHFWGQEEDLGNGGESYTARLSVEADGEDIATERYSFSYRNPTLSNLKLIDFSTDSEKASVLITPREASFIQMHEPGMVDLNLKLLSGTEILYSESLENVPVLEAYYKAMYWPFLLENGKEYTSLLKVRIHSPALTTVYRSDFAAREEVEILDRDVDVDEYGASVTVAGKSQVPFDGVIRVVLTSGEGEKRVFEETADILTAGKEDTVGIIWQGIPKGDYNVRVQVLNLEGEVLDSHETVLRVFEPVSVVTPVEEAPGTGTPLAGFGIFLASALLLRRRRHV